MKRLKETLTFEVRFSRHGEDKTLYIFCPDMDIAKNIAIALHRSNTYDNISVVCVDERPVSCFI